MNWLSTHKVNILENVNAHLPLRWHLLGTFFLSSLIIAGAFIFFAPYSKVEVVGGEIVTDKGIVRIDVIQPGTIKNIMAEEGQAIRKGDTILTIEALNYIESGTDLSEQKIISLRGQDSIIIDQRQQWKKISGAKISEVRSRISNLNSRVQSLERQIGIQERLIQQSAADLDRAQEIAKRGFISAREINTRNEKLLLQRQQMEELRSRRASALAEITENNSTINSTNNETRRQLSELDSNRATIARQLADAQAERTIIMKSPIDGFITALTGKVGQAVRTGESLLVVVPKNAKLQAELHIPTSSIGLVETGQKVTLALDAFPYQQFGTINGKIIKVPSAPNYRPSPQGLQSYYIAIVELEKNGIGAFAGERDLKIGMKTTARVTISQTSLLEWLFEPLFAVGKR